MTTNKKIDQLKAMLQSTMKGYNYGTNIYQIAKAFSVAIDELEDSNDMTLARDKERLEKIISAYNQVSRNDGRAL
jgi:hypothetical protein